MEEATDLDDGNIRGLPTMHTKSALKSVLTSLVYRITMHGCSRLRKALSPGLSYVGNYPACLQDDRIPTPQAHMSEAELLAFMPKTGTIGLMVRFYGIFVFTPPYESFISEDGVDTSLFFPGGLDDPRNQGLVKFRHAVIKLAQRFQPDRIQNEQWPLSIET